MKKKYKSRKPLMFYSQQKSPKDFGVQGRKGDANAGCYGVDCPKCESHILTAKPSTADIHNQQQHLQQGGVADRCSLRDNSQVTSFYLPVAYNQRTLNSRGKFADATSPDFVVKKDLFSPPRVELLEIPDRDYWRLVEEGIADDRIRARHPERLVRELNHGELHRILEFINFIMVSYGFLLNFIMGSYSFLGVERG